MAEPSARIDSNRERETDKSRRCRRQSVSVAPFTPVARPVFCPRAFFHGTARQTVGQRQWTEDQDGKATERAKTQQKDGTVLGVIAQIRACEARSLSCTAISLRRSSIPSSTFIVSSA